MWVWVAGSTIVGKIYGRSRDERKYVLTPNKKLTTNGDDLIRLVVYIAYPNTKTNKTNNKEAIAIVFGSFVE